MIGDKLRRIINERGVTMAEIAVAIGVTPMTITNIVKGSDPKSSTLKNIADYLKIPIGYFFDEDGKGMNTLVNGNNNNVASGHHSQITILKNDIHSKELEIEHLKQIIEEKERLIQVLMKNNK